MNNDENTRGRKNQRTTGRVRHGGGGEFARRRHCHRQNVYDIFRRHNIDLSLLQRISRVLEHDFVTELYGSQSSTKVTLKLAITVEMENGECKVTEVKAVK